MSPTFPRTTFSLSVAARPPVTTFALIVTVSALSPAIPAIVITPPSELTVKLALSARSIVPVPKVIASCSVSNSAVTATFIFSPLTEVIVLLVPLKLYKAPPKLTVSVDVLPIKVSPITPAPPLPIAPVMKISAFPSDAVPDALPSLIFNPPNSLLAPIAPVMVTSPVPDLTTRISSSPSSPD